MFTQVPIIITHLTSQWFLDSIGAVKWSSDGNMIATGSDDRTAKMIDFRSGGKILCKEEANGCKTI